MSQDEDDVEGDLELIEAVGDHIERHIGPIAIVYDEIESTVIHLDVYRVDPTPDRNVYTLVTSGMSQRAINGPAEYLELVMTLPPDWPMTMEAFKREEYWWPIRRLKNVARLPHVQDTWLGPGHTIPNGNPPRPFAGNTEQCCMLTTIPLTVPEAFWSLKVSADREVYFLSVMSIYREEMEFKLKHGSDALFDLFDDHDITDMVDPTRVNVCAP